MWTPWNCPNYSVVEPVFTLSTPKFLFSSVSHAFNITVTDRLLKHSWSLRQNVSIYVRYLYTVDYTCVICMHKNFAWAKHKCLIQYFILYLFLQLYYCWHLPFTADYLSGKTARNSQMLRPTNQYSFQR